METKKSPMNENRLEKTTGDSDAHPCWNRPGDVNENNLFVSFKSRVSRRRGGRKDAHGRRNVSDQIRHADDGLDGPEDGETMPVEKDSNLAETDGDLVRRPKLGFGGALLKNNNGGRKPGTFNMVEFIRLARTVIDVGDLESLNALEELKTKWKTHFGKEIDANSFPTPEPITEPPLVRGLRKAIRNIIPPATGIQTKENNAAIMDGVSSTGFLFSGEIVGRTDMERMNRRDILGSSTPTRLTFADAIADVSPKSAADVYADLAADVTTADMGHDIIIAKEKNSNIGRKIVPVPLFIGNIPLHTNPKGNVEDKIADGFNNSSRKTLNYIVPTRQNGEIIVRPSLEAVRDGSKRWQTKAVGYFLGKRQYYDHLKEFAHSIWPALREVTATANGFIFFQFKFVIDMEEIIEGRPWLFQGQPIVLQKWEPGMAMRKLKHTEVPVWIKLQHLPMEFWTTDELSIVASGVGKPLYPDAITRACTRLDFARVCVMIDVTQTLEKHIIIMTPDEEGGETPCKIDIEYEWLPPKCTGCLTLGHSMKDCSMTKTQKYTKPPVKVYVPKTNVPPPPILKERQKKHEIVGEVDKIPKENHGVEQEERDTSSHKEKGKEVVIYNPFEALALLDDADETTRGPNT
ncbi:UNVERIFIED_CONTAM: hypothetical protein Sindi_1301000 [Sesamum indicum]